MMRAIRKYYFSRKEAAAVLSDNEEEARLVLAQHYESSEDFILDNVIEGVEVDGVFTPTKGN